MNYVISILLNGKNNLSGMFKSDAADIGGLENKTKRLAVANAIEGASWDTHGTKINIA